MSAKKGRWEDVEEAPPLERAVGEEEEVYEEEDNRPPTLEKFDSSEEKNFQEGCQEIIVNSIDRFEKYVNEYFGNNFNVLEKEKDSPPHVPQTFDNNFDDIATDAPGEPLEDVSECEAKKPRVVNSKKKQRKGNKASAPTDPTSTDAPNKPEPPRASKRSAAPLTEAEKERKEQERLEKERIKRAKIMKELDRIDMLEYLTSPHRTPGFLESLEH